MTQRNIDVMDIIVSKMVEGDKLSKALHRVYNKRHVVIPYNEEKFNTPIISLEMSTRTTNALMRAGFKTLGEVIDYCNYHKVTEIRALGPYSGIELFELILDYCWERMGQKEREDFLIDTVERNSDNIRAEIA